MTTWENFIIRRKINITAFLARNNITSRDTLLAHLIEHGIQSPVEEVISALFPKAPEVKIEQENSSEKEEVVTEDPVAPRSDTRQAKRNSGAPGGRSGSEDLRSKDS